MTQYGLTPRSFFEDGGTLGAMERFMNESLERFFRERPMMFKEVEGAYAPRIDITQDEKELKLTAEIPGVDKKDVHVLWRDGYLTIKGEKKIEHEEKRKEYYRSERVYGAFERTFELPAIDGTKIDAKFKDGVLTVTAPKTAEARAAERKIPVN